MGYNEAVEYILKECEDLDLRLMDKEKVIQDFENELKKEKAAV